MNLGVTMKTLCCTGLLASMLAMCTTPSSGLPRFSARTGAKCQSCHVNPSGGGMRQAFGVQYGREVLPVPAWSEEAELADFTNLITNVLGVGADFRTLFFYQQVPDTGASPPDAPDKNAFWQMQGDLYINLRLTKKVNIYLDKGLYSGFEVFGMLGILPARGFIKVGKFVPAFGTKLDDHTAYIRTYTGFSPERGRPELTGLEVGVSPGAYSVVGGFYNGSDGFGTGVGNEKSFLLRADGIWGLGEEAAIGLGFNAFRRHETSGGITTLYGGLGSLSYGPLVLFGEADLVRSDGSGSGSDGLVLYAEANYLLLEGVDLKVAYDFYDPTIDEKDGAQSRYSFGLEFFPFPGVELRPMYRLVKEEPTEIRNNEFHVLIHFYL